MKSILLILLLMLPVGVGRTQDQIIVKPIFTFVNAPQAPSPRIDFAETEWRPDNQSFSFRYVTDETSLMFHYSLANNELESSDVRYPCPYEFSDSQLKTFGAANCSRTISPNGRYIIYPTDKVTCGEGCLSKFAIGDLKTGTYSEIEAWISDDYYIRWSEDSSAFLLLDFGIGEAAGGLGAIWYVRIPTEVDTQIKVLPFMLANFPLGDPGYVDISPDGEQVLVRGGLNSNMGLSLWNIGMPSMPSSNQQFAAWFDGRWLLKDRTVGGATFLPDDPQHILVVTDKGIIKYDLDADTSTVINTQIKSVFPNWVYFSSDVRYALVYTIFPDDLNKQKLTLFQLN